MKVANKRTLTMCCKICYTSHCVALYLDVRAEHLANERLEASELHDEKLIISYAAESS